MHLEMITREPVSLTRPAPLLFVHGMWHAAWCWAENFLPFFAGHGYLASAVSLRGHGGSEGRERLRWFTLADYVADVEQAAAALPAPPILVGASMGGLIVQKYLETHQAHAAVLLDSGPPKGLIPATVRRFIRPPLAMLKANLTPMLVLGAQNGAIMSAQEVQATARAYGVHAKIFPDMAHDMMLERGWRQVAGRMLAWFDELRL